MKLKYIEDYYDKIKERYPDLEMWEIEKILKHGMRSFAQINAKGGDVIIRSPHNNFFLYFGKLFFNSNSRNKYIYLKRKIKCRLKYHLKTKVWDGCYYIGLTEEEYKEFVPKKKGRKKITFKNITIYKSQDECFLLKKNKYYYRITGLEDKGMCKVVDEIVTQNASLIATRAADGKIHFVDEERNS